MAKKTHRTRRQQQTVFPPESTVQQPATSPMAQKMVDFVGEYAYVYKEMRNVFFIAVVMVAVLFVLSYVVY